MHGDPNVLLTTADLVARADFTLGPTLVSPSSRRVAGPGGSMAIEPRVMQILVVLAEAAGMVVTRETLFRRCWGGVYVGEDSLNRAVAGARRVADTVAIGCFAIETIPRTGYRLTRLTASNPESTANICADKPHLDGAIEAGKNAWRLGFPAVPTVALERVRQAAASHSDRADVWGVLALLLRDAVEYAVPGDCASLVDECECAAARALAIDSDEANAMTALASLAPLFGDWFERRGRLLAAGGEDPARISAAHALAMLEMATGRPSAASPIIACLIDRDPLAAIFHYKRVYHLWTLGALGEMDRVADRAMQLWPRHPAIWFARWWSLACAGRPEAALLQLADAASLPEVPPSTFAVLTATAAALAGGGPAAAAVQLNLDAATRGPAQSIAAIIHLAALGAIDAAFDVANGYLLRQGPLVVPIRHTDTDPSITDQHRRVTQMLFIPPTAPMRSDPRFLPLCEAIGLTDYWDRAGVLPDFLAGDLPGAYGQVCRGGIDDRAGRSLN